jgi:hypothetical protein
MKYKQMNLHDKRFLSEASSASPLSPNHHVFSNIKDSSLCVVTITTQSPWGEGDDAAGREFVI